MKKLLELEWGKNEEHLEQFDREFEAAAGETSSLLASNVANTRTFEVKTPDVMIKVHPRPDRSGRNPADRRDSISDDPAQRQCGGQRNSCDK